MNHLRGNFPATIDAKGRLKVPTAFKRHIEEQYGRETYVTSITGANCLIYPIATWEEIEEKLAANAHSHPSVMKFKQRTSYFGQASVMDAQGRILVPSVLREYHGDLSGEVAVLGQSDHLEVWKRDQFEDRMDKDPFTDEDYRVLADLGV